MIAPGAPLPPADLRGVFPACVTPLDERGRVDEASVASFVEWQLRSGVHGLVALGSTGEGPLLATDAKLRLVRAVVQAAAGRVPVVVGITDASPDEAIAFARAAQAAGANAYLASVPFYFLPSQNEALAHFRRLRAELELPIIAYDIPSAVKLKLATATVRTLAEEGAIIGVKDSSGDLTAFRDLLVNVEHRPDFRPLTGNELLFDAALFLGAAGGVLGLASIIPATYVAIYDACQAGDWVRARALQKVALRAFQVVHAGQSGGSFSASAIGSFKAALGALGVIRHATLAAPLQPLTEAEAARAVAVLRASGASEFAPAGVA
jgi:4-hydroxy-tetrahydrodipicolinate synthase